LHRVALRVLPCIVLPLSACVSHTVTVSPPVLLGTPRFEAGPSPRSAAALAPGATLLVPVQGILPEQLRDSYEDPRTGHVHHAIDIMARGGTPVLAAANGTILKLRSGGNGGITIYQLDPDGHTLYYYAHLQRYAAGLAEGMSVQRGQVIAYVGDTGNAGSGNFHLHFSVGRVADPRRWWVSENVNPFPLLAGDRANAGARTGGR
jgi:murein DD-endopeptidase MepM/ murein hydrolase activator NlpD